MICNYLKSFTCTVLQGLPAICSNSDNNPQAGRFYVCGLVSLLGGRLKKYWRIGIHWLIAVKNYLLEIFNDNIVQLIHSLMKQQMCRTVLI